MRRLMIEGILNRTQCNNSNRIKVRTGKRKKACKDSNTIDMIGKRSAAVQKARGWEVKRGRAKAFGEGQEQAEQM